MTSPETAAAVTAQTVALLPIGACEQHAGHLPVSMDAQAAIAVADRVEEARAGQTLLLPPLPYGASDHHGGFAGTISIGTELLARSLATVMASLHATTGIGRFLIINGHGGNVPAMRWALDLVHQEGDGLEARALSYWDALFDALDSDGTTRHGPMGHADRYETSIALALWPDLPDVSDAPRDGFVDDLPAWVQTSVGFRERTTAGGVGDPSGASAAEGHEYLAVAAHRIARLVDGWT